MKTRINISIQKRIYLSFFFLVCLFVLNGIITIITLNSIRTLSAHLSEEVEPSLQALEDFESEMIESKMCITNWVFLDFNQEDKEVLKRLHDSAYPALKSRINFYSSHWENKNSVDSLNKIFAGFEQLLVIEKSIMTSLKEFRDYDDRIIKLKAEREVEEEILPRTASLIKSLNAIHAIDIITRTEENAKIHRSSMKLRMFIILLAITIICAGFLLSLYMTKVIVGPVNRIRHIINNLGLGIIQKIDHPANDDEIGKMFRSVNNLSEKLRSSAAFANEIGNGNFDSHFEPLGPDDTLGKAIIAMRDNLKSSNERMTEAQHIAKLGSWEWNIKTNKLFWSDETYDIFDTDSKTFCPSFEGYMSFVHPEDREHTNSLIVKCLQDHQPFSNELRIISNKNVAKLLFVQGKVTVNHKGEVIKMFGTGQDITERKRGEEKLAEERELLQIIIENIPDQIYVKDTQGRFLLCNMPGAINAGCRSQEDIIGKTDFDFFSPENAKHFFEIEQALLKSGESLINHENYLPPEMAGGPTWALNTKVPFKDRNGKMLGLIGINRDITQRKLSEKKIDDVNRELSILFNSVDEVFFSVDMVNFKVIQISNTCEKLYGYTQSEFLTDYTIWLDIIHPDDQHIIENEDKMLRRGEQVSNQYRIITKNKIIRWVENKITPGLDEDGYLSRVDGVTQDITQRKQDEELIQKSQVKLAINNLELEQKNKELEQFAYVASHDLQEPLRTTTSFVKLFKKQYFGKLDSKADKYLTYIVDASDRMRVLIKDLLDFSRIGHSKEIESADCNLILQEVIADIDTAIKDSDATIKAGRLPVISGYPTEIKQLFQNLIINSLKFRKQNVRPRINITAKENNDYWKFAFNDNGIGIDPEHQERIFIIFQRLHTRTEYEGSGIGLSHCKKIVELHHGKIWVESTPGEGSTFYFTIYSPKEEAHGTKVKLHHAD